MTCTITHTNDGRYEVTVPTVMGSWTRTVDTIGEAFSAVGKFDNIADRILEEQERTAEFLTRPENAYWRA